MFVVGVAEGRGSSSGSSLAVVIDTVSLGAAELVISGTLQASLESSSIEVASFARSAARPRPLIIVYIFDLRSTSYCAGPAKVERFATKSTPPQ